MSSGSVSSSRRKDAFWGNFYMLQMVNKTTGIPFTQIRSRAGARMEPSNWFPYDPTLKTDSQAAAILRRGEPRTDVVRMHFVDEDYTGELVDFVVLVGEAWWAEHMPDTVPFVRRSMRMQLATVAGLALGLLPLPTAEKPSRFMHD